MSSNILDILIGDVLPHVYCRKILIEDSALGQEYFDVTLKLAIYAEKNKVLKSQWLNNLKLPGTDGEGSSLLDAMKISVSAVSTSYNTDRLKPANISNSYVTSMGEIIGETQGQTQQINPESVYAANYVSANKQSQSLHGLPMLNQEDANGEDQYVKEIFNFGDLPYVSADQVAAAAPGEIAEEVFNGKLYYVIPFKFKRTFTFDENISSTLQPNDDGILGVSEGSLGFVFYSYLDTAAFLDGNEAFQLDDDSLYYAGSVNSEIVFENKQLALEAQTFRLPDGKKWEGPVHFHGVDGLGTSGPDATGYIGFMTGLKHRPNISQPTLTVTTSQNSKIVDFRDTVAQQFLGSGILQGQVFDTTSIEETLSAPTLQSQASQTLSLMPYQKENAKLLAKDNDSEFSKLYVTRDRRNNARGFFYLDMSTLLKNNSKFSSLHMNSVVGNTTATSTAQNALNRSQLLQIRLYRDRVSIVKGKYPDPYQKHADQTFYEEPSRYLGAISIEAGTTPSILLADSNLFHFKAISLNSSVANSLTTQYFVFHDKEVGSFGAGHYRYRVELEFKDGTYEYVKEKLNELLEERRSFERYYDIYRHNVFPFWPELLHENHQAGKYQHWNVEADEWNWTFAVACSVLGFNTDDGGLRPWSMLPAKLLEIAKIFGVAGPDFDEQNPNFVENLAKIASPYTHESSGPSGLEYLMNLADNMINQLTILLDGTKLNKKASSSSLSGPLEGPTDDQITRTSPNDEHVLVSPHKSIIYEQFSFDSPQEIFQALQNEDFFVDYLTAGQSFEDGFNGILSLSPGYYGARSRLGDAKFSPLASVTTVWEGNTYGWNMTGPGYAADGNIYPFLKSMGGGNYEQDGEDHLSKNSYSFKTPSIIEVSDPSDSNKSFGYIYNSFRSEALQILQYQDDQAVQSVDEWYDNFQKIFVEGGTGVYPDIYDSPEYSRDTLLAATNYSYLRKEMPSADLSIPYIDPLQAASDSEGPTENNPARANAIATRELYKNLFSRASITFHEASKYGMFFGYGDKNPGATKLDSVVNDVYEEKYQRTTAYHSDGELRSQHLLYKILNTTKHSKIPLSSILNLKSTEMINTGPATDHIEQNAPVFNGTWNDKLPNNFKLWYAHSALAGPGAKYDTLLTVPFKKAFGDIGIFGLDSSQALWNAFAFFNYNMTARIEVFIGHETTLVPAKAYHLTRGWIGDIDPSPTMNTEMVKNPRNDLWRLAVRSDFESGQTNLYRIRFVDRAWLQGLEIPILNKYFIVFDGADFGEPDYTGWVPKDEAEKTENQKMHEWESDNAEKIDEWKTMTEKGLISEEAAKGDASAAFMGDDKGFGNGAGTPPPDSDGDAGPLPPAPPGLPGTDGGGIPGSGGPLPGTDGGTDPYAGNMGFEQQDMQQDSSQQDFAAGFDGDGSGFGPY